MAALLGVSWVVRVFGANINEEMFVRMVQKLIAANNASRAVKLTKAAPKSPLAAATRAGILASAARDEEAMARVGYRGSHDPKPEVFLQKIRAPFDEAFDATAAPLRSALWFALPAPLLFVAAIARGLCLDYDANAPAAAVAGLALLVFVYTAVAHARIAKAKKTSFEALSPSFLAIAENPAALQDQPSSGPALLELEVREPGAELRIVRVDKPIVKIGSIDTCNVQLSAEGVARMHAVIEIEDGGDINLIDLGAAAQTRVNGEPVDKRKLSHGDVLGIGQAEIVVRMAGAQSP